MDPRAQRTIRVLQEAVTYLIREMPAAEISVSELCATAGVHRTTFYKHFGSVSEVTVSLLADLFALIDSRSEPDYSAWLVSVLRHVDEHRRTYRALFGPGGDPAVTRALADRMASRCADFARPCEGDTPSADARSAAYAIGFGSYGLVEAVLAADGDPGIADMVAGFLGAPPIDHLQ